MPTTEKLDTSYEKNTAFAAEYQFQAARRSHKQFVQGGEGYHISLKQI